MIAIIIGILVLVIAIAAFYLSGGFDAGPGPVAAPTLEDIPPEDIGMDVNIQLPEEDEEDELQEDFSMVEFSVPEESGKFKPTSIGGLVGWFTGSSFDNDTGEWNDISGNDNHAVDVLGSPESIEGDRGSNNQKYVIGTENDGLKFPVEVLTTGRKFTMFHVSRYNTEQIVDYAAPGMGRIFDGTDNGFVSGAHGGKTGWAHRNGSGAITHGSVNKTFFNKFSVNTDQKTLYRFNGVQRSGLPNLSALTPGQMTINYGEARASNYGQHGEKSVWAVAEVLFYDRELSGQEIEKIEDYLFAKYGVKKLAYSHQHVRNPFKKEIDGIQNMGVSCGNQGALSSTYLRRHYSRYTQQDENGNDVQVVLPNGNYYFESGCVQGISDPVDGTTKSTEPVERLDSETLNNDGDAWFDSAQKVYNMNCRTSPLTEYKFKQVGEKMKSDYTCSSRKVVEDSCEDKLSENPSRSADGNFFKSMHLEKIDCYPKVLTAMELVKNPEGEGYRIKGKCCNLEDV